MGKSLFSKENEETLKVYDKYAKAYLEHSIQHDAKDPEKAKKKAEWLKDFAKNGFSNLHSSAKILEIGSADDENSIMLKKLGFDVTSSDVAEDFLNAMRDKKLNPIKLNLLADDFPGRYEGVFCWRVFVHFTEADFELALQKIFNGLDFGGRLVFNVLNAESEENDNDGWYDFPGDYHMGAKRYYQYYKQSQIVKIAKNAGFEIIKSIKNGGKGEDKWLCYILEKSIPVNYHLQEYIESEILPQYDPHAGHGIPHIRYVIRRSLRFAEEVPDVNMNMVYTIAAYHDIGRKIDNEHHEAVSAQILLKDQKIKEFFNEDQIKTIAEAIEDHRASLKNDPRSIYGKIVSSADRNTSVEQMLGRTYDYSKNMTPEADEKAIFEAVRAHLRDKYGSNGYAAKKMFFNDLEYTAYSKKIDEITSDYDVFEKVMTDFLKK